MKEILRTVRTVGFRPKCRIYLNVVAVIKWMLAYISKIITSVKDKIAHETAAMFEFVSGR